MAQNKVEIKEETKRNVKVVIIQQGDKAKGAHFFINKEGVVKEGVDITKAGQHCKDNDKESIGIVLEGKYNLSQQTTLMNVLYGCFKTIGKKVPVKPYHVFYPGKTNPDLNIRSLETKLDQNYGAALDKLFKK